MAEDLSKRFREYIRERRLIGPEDRCLLAVSGGVDSMVMLRLFAEAEYPFGVAHCNFCLRGEEGDEDERSVRQEAQRLEVAHYNVRFDTLGEMERTGESMEMAARRLRYDWFYSLCREHGYTKIVIAHHSDDSVETFFINLIRGSGLRGLTGIHVTNGDVIRPMLFASRREILDYAHKHDVSFREDSSNRTTKYLRNKIRLGIIPRIREISPAFGSTMTRNVERLGVALRFIDRQMETIREQITNRVGDSTVIGLDMIDPLLPRDYVIYEMLRGYGFNSDVADDLCRSVGCGNCGVKFYSPSHVAYLNRRHIIVKPLAESEVFQVSVDRQTDRIYAPGGQIAFEELDRDDIESLSQPPGVALLDADLVSYPLTVRLWEEGDWFVPFGMEGRKKVSDFLIDLKVALPDKEHQLVVISGGDIVWVAGRRVDDRYRITDKTKRVLRIVKEAGENPILI